MTALTVTPNTVEWLDERKKHIGASDAPAILGLTPNWRTARDVAKEKLSREKSQMDGENKYFKRGHMLEPLIKRMYIEEAGNEIFAAPMYQHKNYSWMSATPDGWIIGADFEALLECKTANVYTKHEWSDYRNDDEKYDIVPMKYWVQVQHQMAVTDQSRVFVAVVFASEDVFDIFVAMLEDGRELEEVCTLAKRTVDFRIIEVKRDEEFIKKLIRIESEFWSDIEDGVLPSELKYINDSGVLRVANYDDECLLTDLKTSYLQKLLAEEDFEECARRVKEAIGNDAGIYSEFLGKVTYKKGKPVEKIEWKNMAQDLLAKYTEFEEQDVIVRKYTSRVDKGRRLTFPFKYWKLN